MKLLTVDQKGITDDIRKMNLHMLVCGGEIPEQRSL
jgi:hypothetical protein